MAGRMWWVRLAALASAGGFLALALGIRLLTGSVLDRFTALSKGRSGVR